MSKHIGFIGLGNMGRGMCRNLIRAGHTLTVFDTSEAAAEAFRGQAEIAGSVAQVGQNSDVLFLSLPNSNIVESVVAQLLETGLEGKILLDTSTSYPLSTQKLAQQVKEAGGFMLDAPMLAGPEEAESGDLLAVVGGEEEIYQQVGDLLDAITHAKRYMGPSGNGHLMKLAVNYCSLSQAAMFAQVYPVMKRFGLDEKTVYDGLNNEIFDNWVFQFYSKRYVSHDYWCGFSLNNGIKDLGYMKRLFEECNVPGFVLDGALDLARVTLGDQTPEHPLEFADMGRTMYRLFGFEAKNDRKRLN